MRSVFAIVATSIALATAVAATRSASVGATAPPLVPWSELMTVERSAAARSACNSAAAAVLRQPPAPRADAMRALATLAEYVASDRPPVDRGWCLLNERNLFDWSNATDAAATLRRIEARLLASSRVDDRLAGALAMRGEPDPNEALPLLRLALPRQPSNVRIAALQDLNASMRAYLRRFGSSVAAYASVIGAAERSQDSRVVAAGFSADGSLRGPSAGPTLERAVESDGRPAVRAAALDALSDRQTIGDELAIRMIDRGLRDRAEIVRESAMDALEGVYMPSVDEERRIATIAATAPTRAERAFARASLADVRRDRHDPARVRYLHLLERSTGV